MAAGDPFTLTQKVTLSDSSQTTVQVPVPNDTHIKIQRCFASKDSDFRNSLSISDPNSGSSVGSPRPFGQKGATDGRTSDARVYAGYGYEPVYFLYNRTGSQQTATVHVMGVVLSDSGRPEGESGTPYIRTTLNGQTDFNPSSPVVIRNIWGLATFSGTAEIQLHDFGTGDDLQRIWRFTNTDDDGSFVLPDVDRSMILSEGIGLKVYSGTFAINGVYL